MAEKDSLSTQIIRFNMLLQQCSPASYRMASLQAAVKL